MADLANACRHSVPVLSQMSRLRAAQLARSLHERRFVSTCFCSTADIRLACILYYFQLPAVVGRTDREIKLSVAITDINSVWILEEVSDHQQRRRRLDGCSLRGRIPEFALRGRPLFLPVSSLLLPTTPLPVPSRPVPHPLFPLEVASPLNQLRVCGSAVRSPSGVRG